MSSWVLRQGDGSPYTDYRYVGQVRGVDLIKTTVNPLDPKDFPVASVAQAVARSGFMVVDDVAKTASLVWKFSDGTTKKFDLT